MTTVIIGRDAIDFAEQNGLTLRKYNDPIEAARSGLSVAEAREIAAQDPSLIYVEVESTINLATFVANFSALRVMENNLRGDGFDAGSVADYFGGQASLIQVGDSRGEDAQRGAYDWWPLTINGAEIGELRDDATGMTVHVVCKPDAP